MRNTLRSTWMAGLAVMFAGCLLPEYSVDESLGSGGAGEVYPNCLRHLQAAVATSPAGRRWCPCAADTASTARK